MRHVWSFFSGAMGLDLGLEKAGLAPSVCVELDGFCCETIRRNRPDVALIQKDIASLSGASLRELTGVTGDVFLMAGGPPCQSFSSGGKRQSLTDARGNLVMEYLRLIEEIRPKFFILENVANLITSALRHRAIQDRPGQHWNLKQYGDIRKAGKASLLDEDELSGTVIRAILARVNELGYGVTFGILDSRDFGAPQRRLRFVLLGSRDGKQLALPTPTHGEGKIPFNTLQDSISDLEHNPGPHSEYTPKIKYFFNLIHPGGNWRSLPKEHQRSAMGDSFASGGGKTGFFRRLDWANQSPTIPGRANRKATGLCHPTQLRPLSVRECARLQGFPDDWWFDGPMNQQYQQIGNAVPVAMGEAIGLAVAQRKTLREPLGFDVLLEAAAKRLRNSARNHKAGAKKVMASEELLFV
ncbi:DNA (cytosine-5)-methyltransferase 1 [Granulicella pectinivorans]|uniref:DNA (cytosine-5-)-methyltransferase n=1 Tax=Granulicella pectinivorans TaxID=474950 RepID=A0A1I6L1Y3_9BACT|nr:DNA cytosine methyltransferase [Granulicella pectinivorans]SFR97456.1 DNA (cytosine-5)-methyltransferase 1 [Granulicella pectinivorans]